MNMWTPTDGSDSDSEASLHIFSIDTEEVGQHMQEPKAEGETSAKPTRIGRVTFENGRQTIVDEADCDDNPLDQNSRFAVLVTPASRWPRNKEYAIQTLQLVSPSLTQLFQSTVMYFPGVQVEGPQPSIPAPFAPLYFHHDDMSKAALGADEQGKQDFEVLEQVYSRHVRNRHEMIRERLDQGAVLYEDLWALFKPGDIVYLQDEYDQPRLYVLITVKYRKGNKYGGPSDLGTWRFDRLAADMWAIDWQPSTRTFQRCTVTRCIKSFSGSRSVASLPFYPLAYYADGSLDLTRELVDMLRQRGQKWKHLVSSPPSCVSYNGPAHTRPFDLDDELRPMRVPTKEQQVSE
jgi:hypothetical protein